MFHLNGPSTRFCDGLSRRNFLKVGAFGAGLSLADVLRLRAASGTLKSSSHKAAIMIYLPGGPSHIDTFDPKPDAPAEFRGEFKALNTKVPGVQISEHLPLLAGMFDQLAVIRSVMGVDEHSDSNVMTGFPARVNTQAHHPSFGSVVSKLRGNTGADVPPFVSLRGMSPGTEPGFLGIAHRPFAVGGPGQANLSLANGVSMDRVSQRRDLLGGFDDLRREIDTTGTLAGLDSFTERAFDMVLSGKVRDALDAKKEDPRVRERYKGVEQFMTARRLVEAGVSCVTLSYGGWDTHGNNFTTLKKQLPMIDRGVSNMVRELNERGLADDVLVVMWGEFGRTPKINGGAGRDHWSPVMSALVAGGGLKMGQAIGASTARGERPKDRPYTAPQVLSTLYQAMGIDPAMTFENGSGRPMYILEDRQPVTELL